MGGLQVRGVTSGHNSWSEPAISSPLLSAQLWGVLSAERLACGSLQEHPSCRAASSQDIPFSGRPTPRVCSRSGVQRPGHFDPMWDNSEGHVRDPCGFDSSSCWATQLLFFAQSCFLLFLSTGLLLRHSIVNILFTKLHLRAPCQEPNP